MRLLDKKRFFQRNILIKQRLFKKLSKKTSLKFNFCFKIIIYKSIDMLLEIIGHTKLIANSGLIDATKELNYSQNDRGL